MDGDEDAIDYNDDDPEDEEVYEEDPTLSYDEENQTMKRVKSKLTMLKSMKSYQMILGEEVELSEEDDEKRILKTRKKNKS